MCLGWAPRFNHTIRLSFSYFNFAGHKLFLIQTNCPLAGAKLSFLSICRVSIASGAGCWLFVMQQDDKDNGRGVMPTQDAGKDHVIPFAWWCHGEHNRLVPVTDLPILLCLMGSSCLPPTRSNVDPLVLRLTVLHLSVTMWNLLPITNSSSHKCSSHVSLGGYSVDARDL